MGLFLGWLQKCVLGLGSSRKNGICHKELFSKIFRDSLHWLLTPVPWFISPSQHLSLSGSFCFWPVQGEWGRGESCSGFLSCSKAGSGLREGAGVWSESMAFQVEVPNSFPSDAVNYCVLRVKAALVAPTKCWRGYKRGTQTETRATDTGLPLMCERPFCVSMLHSLLPQCFFLLPYRPSFSWQYFQDLYPRSILNY